ncbi:hypothetical protein N8475_10350 [Winogradskyella sp.]|nr:hypothetical protein [Winogradskyella sp.]
MLRKLYNTYKYHFKAINSKTTPSQKKFVIVSMGRTGSTLLTSLLNAHPAIYADSEILMNKNHIKLFAPQLFIRGHELKANQRGKTVYGFKVKEEQISRENKLNSNKFLQSLNEDGYQIIRLIRKNRVKLALSVYQAWHDNIYEIKKIDSKKVKSIEVNPKKLLEILNFHTELLKKEEDALEGLNYITVNYEEHLFDQTIHQHTADQIFKYLDVDRAKENTPFKKKAEDDLKVLINNYDEVSNFLENTQYAQYF